MNSVAATWWGGSAGAWMGLLLGGSSRRVWSSVVLGLGDLDRSSIGQRAALRTFQGQSHQHFPLLFFYFDLSY